MLSQRIGFLSAVLNTASNRRETLPGKFVNMLKSAASDFAVGYQILQAGDAENNLPHWEPPEVQAILSGDDGKSGRNIIERFLVETKAILESIETDSPQPEKDAADFSEFVLTEVLGVLQQIVTALEQAFEAEMIQRQERRDHETVRVMAAIQDIQKASKFSRMIALNAKISANRAGPHGMEFGALTDEIKQISVDITKSSEEIMKYLEPA